MPQIFMNNSVYLELLILELSEIAMYQFKYDYIKPKYIKKAKLCFMNTDTFIVCIKQMIFVKTLQKMLKASLTHQIKSCTDHYQMKKQEKKCIIKRNLNLKKIKNVQKELMFK